VEGIFRHIGDEQSLEFPFVMSCLRGFPHPINQAIIDEEEYFKIWDCKFVKWKQKMDLQR
jgi:hypothetical protein